MNRQCDNELYLPENKKAAFFEAAQDIKNMTNINILTEL